ncbi:hypothetical protein GCM10012319_15220 [Comamonas sp. KCTC 72670]|nr:hypothetical protein GCM10012319_15220 [Comamonas sp. KCTC 72670]
MVEDEQQDMVRVAETEEVEAVERSVLEREGARSLLSHPVPREVGDVLDMKDGGRNRRDVKRGPAFLGDEDGAKGGVPLQKEAEGRIERVEVERAAKLDGFGDVVGAQLGLELVKEPEALLGEGGEERLGGGPRRGRGERRDARELVRRDDASEGLDGRSREEGGERQLNAEGLPES